MVNAQVHFKDMAPSEALEADIRTRIDELDGFCPGLQTCRVVVEAPPKHHKHGGVFRILIEVKAPGHDIVVDKGNGEHHAHEDAYIAVRDAFRAVKKRLQSDVRS